MTIKKLLSAIAATGAMTLTLAPANASSDPFLGEIMAVGYTFCPRGWTEADGKLLQISDYSALFSLYGTNYGGDGRTTFGMPDLRGRAAVGQGEGRGVAPTVLGQMGGGSSVKATQEGDVVQTQAFTTIRWCVATVGIYPSRN